MGNLFCYFGGNIPKGVEKPLPAGGIRRKTYKTRQLARQDVFDYVEIFYNPKRKHSNNGMLSPVGFEMAAKMKR